MAQERARYEAELRARNDVGSSSTLANFSSTHHLLLMLKDVQHIITAQRLALLIP
jgi:hypothetical protein